MHRNPILSRITDTTPNKLGVDFYIRIATFGAVPVLTWLAYQFPEIGGKSLQNHPTRTPGHEVKQLPAAENLRPKLFANNSTRFRDCSVS